MVEAGDGRFSYASTCHQCKEPLCLYSCLTGALYRDDDGMVRVEQARCVGCWTCVLACPYGAIRPGVETSGNPASGNPYGNVFSFDSSSAGSGDAFQLLVSTKCDLCQGRRESPACVDACPNGALVLADHVPARWREVTQIVVEQLEPQQAGSGDGRPLAGVVAVGGTAAAGGAATAGGVATTGGEGREEAGNVA